MPRKPESENFIDMFARLGQDLKMPPVDVERILEHNRKNLEALEKAARTATSGASSMFARQREILEETLREITDMAQDFRTPGSPQELMSKQAEFARRSFETAVKNASDIGEVVRKSSGETIEILRERIREAMEEVREGFGRRK